MDSVTSSQTRSRLVLADDHVLFADALRVFLEKSYEVVGVLTDGRSLVTEAARLRPDLLVIDVSLPLLNGIDAARRIREQNSQAKLLFLTMHQDEFLAAAAVVEFGPFGFVLKHEAGLELLTAMDAVLSGRAYVSRKLRATDGIELAFRANQYESGLTHRQRDIVQLLAEGKAMKEVAHLLGISEKTVEFHKRNVMDTFGLKTTPDLVLFALKNRLIWAEP